MAANYTVSAYAINSCGQESSFPSLQYYYYMPAATRGGASGYAYPNPVDDVLTVDINALASQFASGAGRQAQAPVFDIRLYDGQGNLLQQQTAKGGTVQFNVSNLPDGMYYLHIYDDAENKPIMETIVVEH